MKCHFLLCKIRGDGKAIKPEKPEDLPLLMIAMLSGEKADSMNTILFSFRSLFKILLPIFCVCLFQQCTHQKADSSPATDTAKKAGFRPVHIRYAQGFSIDKFSNYTLISVFNPFQDRSDTLQYLLVPRGDKLPKRYSGQAQLIRTPVRSMIATSTTHIALVEMLKEDDIIKGMVGAKYAYSKTIRQKIASNKITSFNQGEFNDEVALNMHPDLVMLSAGQASEYDNYHLLVDSGIAIFVNAEWLETTPLGKAEWLKVMGALVEKDKQANRMFKEVAKRYEKLKARAQQAKNIPLVINNMPHKGTWFVSGGSSFTAQFLKDAVADYPWFRNKSMGGLRLDYEIVYKAGLQADVWINPGTAKTRGDILAKDSRFKDFKSFKTDRIYNNNKRMSSGGGNDFWEKGVVRPDLILSDLITIFHPDLVKNDSLYFYQKVK